MGKIVKDTSKNSQDDISGFFDDDTSSKPQDEVSGFFDDEQPKKKSLSENIANTFLASGSKSLAKAVPNLVGGASQNPQPTNDQDVSNVLTNTDNGLQIKLQEPTPVDVSQINAVGTPTKTVVVPQTKEKRTTDFWSGVNDKYFDNQTPEQAKSLTDSATKYIAKDVINRQSTLPQQWQQNIGTVPFTDPNSLVNQVSNPHGDPTLTSSQLQDKISSLQRQKAEMLANSVLNENIDPYKAKKDIDAQIQQAQDLYGHVIDLQLVNRDITNDDLSAGRFDGVRIGLEKQALMGDKNAEQKLSQYNKGNTQALSYDERMRYQAIGLSALQNAKKNLQANNSTEAASYVGEKSDNPDAILERDNPQAVYQGKRNEIINNISNLRYDKDNSISSSIFGVRQPDQEEVNQLAEKLGYTPDDLKKYNITPDDVKLYAGAIQKGIKSAYNMTSAPAVLAYEQAARAGAKLGILNPDAVNEHFQAGWQDREGVKAALPGLFGENQPEAQIYDQENPSIHKPSALLGEMAGGIGTILGAAGAAEGVSNALTGEKLLGAVGLGEAPEVGTGLVENVATANKIGNFASMAIPAYNDAYTNSLNVIGEKPEDGWKRQLYAVSNALINGGIMMIDPQAQIGRDIIGETSAGRNFIDELSKMKPDEVAEKLTQPALENKYKQIAKETAKHLGLQMAIPVANTIATNASNAIANPQGNYGLFDNVGRAAVNGAISMFAPSLWHGSISPKMQTDMNKGLMWEVGSNPDKYGEQAYQEFQKGNITADQYKDIQKSINVLNSTVNEVPQKSVITDQPLTPIQQQEYAWNLLQQKELNSKLEIAKVKDDKAETKAIQSKLTEIEGKNTDILNSAGELSKVETPDNPFVLKESKAKEYAKEKSNASKEVNTENKGAEQAQAQPESETNQAETTTDNKGGDGVLLRQEVEAEEPKAEETTQPETKEIKDISEKVGGETSVVNDVPVTITDGLQTQDDGKGQGMPIDATDAKMQENTVNNPDKPVDTGLSDKPTGETFDEAKNRVKPIYDQVVKSAKNNTVVVTHSWVLNLIKAAENVGWDSPDLNKEHAKIEESEKNAPTGSIMPVKTENGTVYFVRHGEVENQKELQRSDNSELTDKGRQQAADIANELKEKYGVAEIPQIIASSLPRAVETSHIIAENFKGKEGEAEIPQAEKEEQTSVKEKPEIDNKLKTSESPKEVPKITPKETISKNAEKLNKRRSEFESIVHDAEFRVPNTEPAAYIRLNPDGTFKEAGHYVNSQGRVVYSAKDGVWEKSEGQAETNKKEEGYENAKKQFDTYKEGLNILNSPLSEKLLNLVDKIGVRKVEELLEKYPYSIRGFNDLLDGVDNFLLRNIDKRDSIERIIDKETKIIEQKTENNASTQSEEQQQESDKQGSITEHARVEQEGGEEKTDKAKNSNSPIGSEPKVVPTESKNSGERRKAGAFIQDGIVYDRQNEIMADAPKGDEGVVNFSTKVSQPFAYQLVEANQLQPATLNKGINNPLHFIPEAQPKNRKGDSSIKGSEDIADKNDFKQLGENSNAYSGAPIVNMHGEVIQGNNRSEGIKKHYDKGYKTYKQELAKNAEKFGLTADQVNSMEQPVLVRVADVSDRHAIELGQFTSSDIETGNKKGLDPRRLARQISEDNKKQLFDAIDSKDDKTLNEVIRDNFDRIFEIIKPYLDGDQISAIKTGMIPTKEGINDIEKVFQQYLFEGADDPNIGEHFDRLPISVQKGILKSFMDITGVEKDKSLLHDLQNSITAITDFNSQKLPFADWKRTPELFNNNKSPQDVFTPLELSLAEKLMKSKKIMDVAEIFSGYKKIANGSPVTIFDKGVEPLSKQDAVKQIFKIDNNEQPQPKINPKDTGIGKVPNEKKTTTAPAKSATKSEPKEVTEKQTPEKSAPKLSQSLRDWGKRKAEEKRAQEKARFPEGAEVSKSGFFDTADVIEKVTDKIADLIEAGEDIHDAIKKAIAEFRDTLKSDDDVDKFDQEARDFRNELLASQGLEPKEEEHKTFEEQQEESANNAVFSLQHAFTEAEREKKGYGLRTKREKVTDEEYLANAKDIITNKPEQVEQLIEKAEKDPTFTPSAQESVVLGLKGKIISDELEEATNSYNKAKKLNTPEGDAEALSHQIRIARLKDQEKRLFPIIERMGSEQGAAFRLRAAFIKDRYSISRMIADREAANNGKELTEEQRAEVEALHEKIKTTDDAYKEYVAQQEAKNKAQEAEILELRRKIQDDTKIKDKKSASKKLKDFASKILYNKADPTPKEIKTPVKDALEKIAEGLDNGKDLKALVKKAIEENATENPEMDNEIFEKRLRKAIDDSGITKEEPKTQTKSATPKPKQKRAKQVVEARSSIDKLNELLKKDTKDITASDIQQIRKHIKDLELSQEKIEQIAEIQRKIKEHKDSQAQLEAEINKGTELTPEENEHNARIARQIQQNRLAIRNLEKSLEIPQDLDMSDVEKNADLERRIKEGRDALDKLKETYGEPEADLSEPENEHNAIIARQSKQGLKALKDFENSLKTPEELTEEEIAHNEQVEAERLENRKRLQTLEKNAKKIGLFDEKGNRDPIAEKLAANTQRARLKHDEDVLLAEMKNRSKFENGRDIWLKWQRNFFKLSSPIVMGKLTSAALWRLAGMIADDVSGTLVSKILPKLSKQALGEGGGLRVNELAKSYTTGFMKGMQDIAQLRKTGKTDLEVLYGKDKVHLTPKGVEYVGLLHEAIKAPVKRIAFEKAMIRRTENYMNYGYDVSDPLVMMKISQEAYRDAERQVFKQDNKFAKLVRKSIEELDAPDKETGEKKLANLLASTAIQEFVPFTRVPVNIITEGLSYSFGSEYGALKLIMQTIKYKGIDNIPHEQADYIMRQLKKGLVGDALVLMGYFAANSLGGFWQKNEKKKEGEPEWQGAKIGNTRIPAFALENPAIRAMQLGATFRHATDEMVAEKDEEGKTIGHHRQGANLESATAAALGLFDGIPLSEQLGIIREATTGNPNEKSWGRGELLRQLFIPQFLDFIAKRTDPANHEKMWDKISEPENLRQPKTPLQHVEASLPNFGFGTFNREHVPLKKNKNE
jgi:broad specificity phosphatase PhoE